jgi:pimeloyl-ACP methyl ester carboxylesterase
MTGDTIKGNALGRAQDAQRQIKSVVRFIVSKTGNPRVGIVAHSWGTIPAAQFAIEQPASVQRLVLFGPVITRSGTVQPTDQQRFWDVTAEFQQKRFAGLVPKGVAPLIDPADLTPWLRTYIASDQTSGRRNPPSVRVPYGPAADVDDAWNGIDLYNPADIRAPTLIIYGEWDETCTTDDARRLFDRMTRAPEHQLTILSRGTHVMHLESGRHQLHDAVAAFLEASSARQ